MLDYSMKHTFGNLISASKSEHGIILWSELVTGGFRENDSSNFSKIHKKVPVYKLSF